MTRIVVAIEGVPTSDGRILLPGALTPKHTSIQVNSLNDMEIVGKATDFERNAETGELSFNITTQDETLLSQYNFHVYLADMKEKNADGKLIVISGDIMGITLSLSGSGWTSLNRIEV